MALEISSDECLQVHDFASFIVWSSTRNLHLRKSACFSMRLCESGQLIQSVEALVKSTVPTHFLHLRVCACLPVLFSVLLALVTCTDDPHRLKRAIKTHFRSQLISLSTHAVASMNKSLTSKCLRILEHIFIGSHRKEIAHGGGSMIQ